MSNGLSQAFNIARTGFKAVETSIAVKSQNLASQRADGYKKQFAVISDLGYIDDNGVGAQTAASGTIDPAGAQVGAGVQVLGIYRSFTDGDYQNTDEAFDIAIHGNGLYPITMPDGSTAYTRVAAFQRAPDGTMVTLKGHALSPKIIIPNNATSIRINEDGQVLIEVSGQTDYQNIGQIQLATFINPTGLKGLGGGLYKETAASGAATLGTPGTENFGTIKQGERELSNVNAIEDITDLIMLQRIYENLSQVLATGKSIASTLTSKV